MRVVDAYWEKRNLGVSTAELYIDGEDRIEEVERLIKEVDAEYIVAKVASGATDKMLFLQEKGYRLIETSILLESRISKMKIPCIYQRFDEKISFIEADRLLIKRVLEEVARGKIFKTDRIALDSYFSEKIAGKRYSNWIKDELDRDAVVYIALYKDVPVSFTIVKPISATIYNSFLGGVFEGEESKGFGFTGLPGIARKVAEKGGKKIRTSVSSNNLPILRLHMDFGYEIQAMDSVFIKHQ